MKQLQPGMVFGTYNVVRLLGTGGMGEVWLLESKTDGTPVAVKILNETEAADHDSRRRFVREAELAMNIRHENVVSVYDVGEDPDTELCYILMEYVPGGTLADYLQRKGRLAIEDAVSVVHAIARVLELAHSRGFVHRDVKPANIMFGADGTPKLADLGIARTRPNGGNTTTVTQTGVMIGTPAYMSPEQMLDSHAVDIRADIYSLGIVLYEMLVGERPNKDASVVQLMAKAVAGEPIPDVRLARPEVPATIAQMLSFMCAPKPENRVASPLRIVEWCEKILAGKRFVLVPHHKTGQPGFNAMTSDLPRTESGTAQSPKVIIGAIAVVIAAFFFGFLSSKIFGTSQPDRTHRAGAQTVPAVAQSVEAKPIEVKLEPASEAEVKDEVEESEDDQRGLGARLMDYSTTVSVQKALDALFPGWKTTANKERLPDDVTRHEGFVAKHAGRRHCVCTHPVSREQPVVTISRELELADADPVLRFSVSAHSPESEFRLTVRVNGTLAWEGDIGGEKWQDVTVDLSNWAGLNSRIELEHRATGWDQEWAYWSRLEVGTWDGSENRVFRPKSVEPLLDWRALNSDDPTLAVQNAAKKMFPGWEISENGCIEDVGYLEEYFHRRNVLLTHPPREGVPVTFTRTMVLPKDSPQLVMEVATARKGDFELQVLVDEQMVHRETVEWKDGYKHIVVPLKEWAGYSVKLEIKHQPTGWMLEHAYWSKIEVESAASDSASRRRENENRSQQLQ